MSYSIPFVIGSQFKFYLYWSYTTRGRRKGKDSYCNVQYSLEAVILKIVESAIPTGKPGDDKDMNQLLACFVRDTFLMRPMLRRW